MLAFLCGAMEYASDGGATGSRYITKITDKRGNDLNFAYTFASVNGYMTATKITVNAASGESIVYDRGGSSCVASITRMDWMLLPTEPARWSMPCALTEIDPPTVNISVDCMALTAYFGCRIF